VSTDDGVRLHYEETGEGVPVLFVHEFAGDHRSWEPQVRALSRRHRCIAYAARGYPPSDVPDGLDAYSQDRAVADALAVLDAAGVERAHVAERRPSGFGPRIDECLSPDGSHAVSSLGRSLATCPCRDLEDLAAAPTCHFGAVRRSATKPHRSPGCRSKIRRSATA